MLDAKHLLWLAEVVDLGSMTQAAQKLHVTQPTLSRAIQILEEHVGGKVLERERHGVRPTAIGTQLVDLGRRIAATRADAQDAIDLWRSGLDGELRVGVGSMLATTIMGDFFATTVQSQPRYSLRVMSATASRLIELLNEDQLDVVFAPESMNLFQDDLAQHRLMTDRLAVFAGNQNALTKLETVSSDLLEREAWISVGALSGISGSNEEVFSRLGMRNVPSTISFTGDITMALQVMKRANALCVLPRKLVGLSAVMQDIVEINTVLELPRRNVAFWSRKKDRDRPELLDLRARVSSFFNQVEEPK